MNKQFNVGDENYVANVIIQNMNLTQPSSGINEEHVRQLVSDALIKSLPELISQPKVVEHLRGVTKRALNEATTLDGEVEEVARQVWQEAEPQIATFLEKLVAESQATARRLVFERITTEFRETRFELPKESRHVWRTELVGHGKLELVKRGKDWEYVELRVEGDSDCRHKRHFSYKLDHIDHSEGWPPRSLDVCPGTYLFEFQNGTDSRKRIVLEYRFEPEYRDSRS